MRITMKCRIFTRGVAVLGLFLLLGTRASAQGSVKVLKDYLRDLPFAAPELTEGHFPDHSETIAEKGAVPDGKTLATKAFRDAILSCSKAGGGTVIVPPGTWLTGPFALEDNINLRVEQGAVVQFTPDIAEYPLIRGLNGKSKRYQITPPIHGYGLKNIAITGEGIIDGAGEAWRPVKKEKQTARQWKDLIASGGVVSPDGKVWWPSQGALEGEKYLKDLEAASAGRELTAEDYLKAREYLRPNLIELVSCRGILLDGPTFRNSPRFHVHPSQSEDIIIRNIRIQADWWAQNGDGLDLSACRNVLVYNSTLDVGDDGLCIKPGRPGSSQSPGPACQNIVIADCVVYHAHGGFVIGSESNGGARNISVRNCVFIGTDVGLRFKSARGRGGLVENIFVDGIQMRSIGSEAILFDMFYGEGDPASEAARSSDTRGAEAVTALTPEFRNFSIRNVVCNGAAQAIRISGLPEMPVRNISIQNVRISAEKGVLFSNADSVSLKIADIAPGKGPVITLVDTRDISLSTITYPAGAELFIKADGAKTRNVRITGTDLTHAKKDVDLGAEAAKDAVIRQ